MFKWIWNRLFPVAVSGVGEVVDWPAEMQARRQAKAIDLEQHRLDNLVNDQKRFKATKKRYSHLIPVISESRERLADLKSGKIQVP